MEVQVNFLAIVVAMASSLAVGSIWYAPSMFGKAWMKLTKVDPQKDGGSVFKPIAISAVVGLFTAYVLAHVTYLSYDFFGTSFTSTALSTAFWMWLGFVAARLITHDAFEGRPMKLTALNLGNELVTLMLMGAIIGLFGL